MIHLLVVLLIAILAYWLLVPVAGLPVLVGAVAAILIIVLGLTGADRPGRLP